MFKAKDKVEGLNRLKALYRANLERTEDSFDFQACRFEYAYGKYKYCLVGIAPEVFPEHFEYRKHSRILNRIGGTEWRMSDHLLTSFFDITVRAMYSMFFPITDAIDERNGSCLSTYVTLKEAMANFKVEINKIAKRLGQPGVR